MTDCHTFGKGAAAYCRELPQILYNGRRSGLITEALSADKMNYDCLVPEYQKLSAVSQSTGYLALHDMMCKDLKLSAQPLGSTRNCIAHVRL